MAHRNLKDQAGQEDQVALEDQAEEVTATKVMEKNSALKNHSRKVHLHRAEKKNLTGLTPKSKGGK